MSTEARETSIRGTIDVVVGVMLVLAGIAGVASGAIISALADRDDIAQLVADEAIQADGITDQQLVDLVYGSLYWGGLGIASAGALVLLGALVFALVRVRNHRRGRPHGSLYADAVVGAVVTLLTSFVPFSPLIGGIVGGYLARGDGWRGARVGIVVGLLVAAPVVLAAGVLAVGYADAEQFWASLVVVLLAVGSAIMALLFAGAGGYIGGYVRTDRES